MSNIFILYSIVVWAKFINLMQFQNFSIFISTSTNSHSECFLCIKLSWLLYYYQNSIIKDNLNYAFCYSQPKLLKYTSIKMLSHNRLILDLPELWGYLFANLISSPCSNTFGKYPAVFFTLLEIHKAQDMLNISRSKKLKKNLIMITPTVFIIINQTFPFPCNIYWKSILKKVFT